MLGLRCGLQRLKQPAQPIIKVGIFQSIHTLHSNTNATARTLRKAGSPYDGSTQRLNAIGRGSRGISFLRMLPARLLALPAMVGVGAVQGYEQLKKSTQLPDLPTIKIDELGDDAIDFLGKLTAQVREQQALNAKGHDDAGPLESPPATDDVFESAIVDSLPEMPVAKRPSESPGDVIDRLQVQLDEAYTRHQGELIEERTRLQKEIERLLLENEELRKSYLELHSMFDGGNVAYSARSRRSAIEMYSDMLDLLSKYNKDFDIEDSLPRVIVVGDQSAGKTSVLEMLVQSRIFPRGHGEMMTRAPVQVTMSEGPKKIAHFADSSSDSTSRHKDRVYDLTSETELKLLRTEIHSRMMNSVRQGDAVSMDTISLVVRGPGLQRMVMVDLPGIIGHVTAGMAVDTKDRIIDMCKHHVNNPNSIILCVQDGSVDAERSNVADLVSQVDPNGERTIFVLTKVDVAEAQNTASTRMKNIMDGKLFRMKALGYFAVITGKGQPDESIEEIKQYEEDFFATSKLFREGALRPHQTTTQNMARAVAQEFWNRVRVSVAEQAEIIRTDLATKELQWKNTYSGRMMSRDELFSLGKHEILESMAQFGSISAREWEDILRERLWESISEHLVSDLYINAAKTARTTDFKTRVDVQLIDWARRSLPQECVALARQTFMDRFDECVRGDGKSSLKDSPDIFVALKEKIVSDSMQKHAWHRDVSDNLRVIQTNSLEDDEITDAGQWYLAVDFMQNKLQREATAFSSKMREYFGPGWTERWFYWTSGTSEQAIHASIASELGAFFKPERDGAIPKAKLHHDSIITVRNNILQNTGEHVSDAQIIDVYNKLYTGEFLSRSVQSASYCKSKYSSNSRDAPNGLKCKDVVMFWRVQEMLHVTAKTLRQQIMYHQAKLEAEVKQHLDVLSESEASKKELISSERVELAQQIEVRRHLLQSLDGFIQTISIKANAT